MTEPYKLEVEKFYEIIHSSPMGPSQDYCPQYIYWRFIYSSCKHLKGVLELQRRHRVGQGKIKSLSTFKTLNILYFLDISLLGFKSSSVEINENFVIDLSGRRITSLQFQTWSKLSSPHPCIVSYFHMV